MLITMLDLRNSWSRILVVSVLWLLVAGPLSWSVKAADNAEARNLFRTASEAMSDKAFERAAGEFNQFLQKFPNSPRFAEAAISLAENYFELKQYDEVLKTVDLYQSRAASVADRLAYLKARSLWEKGQYAEAAQAWKAMTEAFSKSKLQPEAVYWEALARFKEKDWSGLISALTEKGRPFAKVAEADPANVFVVRTRLLLAEAQLEKKELAEAEKGLLALAEQTLPPEQIWQRLQLLTRVQQQASRFDDAAQTSIGLLAQARALGRSDLIAESVALRAELLQALKQPDAALEMWQANLSDNTPPERRRQALFAVIALSTEKGNTEQARTQLTEFLRANPNDPAQSLVRLTLGELALKDFYKVKAVQPAVTDTNLIHMTNLLQMAKVQFDAVLTNTAVSNITGRAYLGRGWYGWEMGAIEAAQSDFKLATEALPESNDQAIARFKWADTQFLRNDLEGASANYSALVEQYRGVTAVREGLLDQALYQLVRVGVRQKREDVATYALEKLREWFPESYYSENSLLLVGQALGQGGKVADARRLLDDFMQQFPNSAKASEIQLARARISVREQNWTDAITIYANWLGRFTNDVARPRAVFDLGWLRFKAGDEAQAFITYTNFVSDFSTNALVPQAHFWLAEHYERKKDFSGAERHYQLVFQSTNLPPGELSHRARLLAGRAALSRQGYKEAQGYFTWLITNGPPQVTSSTISTQLVAQAYFALGDTHLADSAIDPARAQDKFGDAINAFTFIEQFFKDTPLFSVACGKIASCHLQYAVQDPTRYEKASEYFTKALESPLATVETRGLAEIGLGKVKEKLAERQTTEEARTGLWKSALEHYENVVYGRGLKEGEELSPAVTEQAGLAGAQLLWQRLNRREQAISFYQRLAEKVPALRESVEKRIAELTPPAPAKQN
ncbi:MAG: tetratricopeptide repeat protein [Verrucomicrobia bacterium]|jgi:outer membrane protein assembly factor BamD (BamD/ComL family)|nr:tetratricopeptide repeat protein [Verrucomicrobiota bacterium]